MASFRQVKSDEVLLSTYNMHTLVKHGTLQLGDLDALGNTMVESNAGSNRESCAKTRNTVCHMSSCGYL